MSKYKIFKLNCTNKKPVYVFSTAGWAGLASAFQIRKDAVNSISLLTYRQFIREWLKYEISCR